MLVHIPGFLYAGSHPAFVLSCSCGSGGGFALQLFQGHQIVAKNLRVHDRNEKVSKIIKISTTHKVPIISLGTRLGIDGILLALF